MRALALALALSCTPAAAAWAAGASSARSAPRQQPAGGVAPISLPAMTPQAQPGSLAGAMQLNGVLKLPGAAPLLDPARTLPGVGFRPDLPLSPLPESAVAPRAEAAAFLETFAPRQALPLTAPPPAEALVHPSAPMAQQSALMTSRQAAVAEATSAMARETSPDAETSQAFGDKVWTLLLGQKPAGDGGAAALPDPQGWSDLGAAGRASDARASGAQSLSPALPRSAAERRDPASARLAVPSVAAQVQQVLSWPMRFDLGALLSPAGAAAAPSARPLRLPIRRLVLKVYSMTLGVANAAIPGHAPVLEASRRAASLGPSAPQNGRLELSEAGSAPSVGEAPGAFSSLTPRGQLSGVRAVEQVAPGAEAERFAFLQESGERLPLLSPVESVLPAAASSPFSRKGAGPAPVAFLVVTLMPVLGAALMLVAGRD